MNIIKLVNGLFKIKASIKTPMLMDLTPPFYLF